MNDAKQTVEDLIRDIAAGVVAPREGWDRIQALKDQYVTQYNEQSWHSYIGKKFQQIIHAILQGYVGELKQRDSSFGGLEVLKEGEVKRNEVLKRKLSIDYGPDLLLPDVDSVIVWMNKADPWKSDILAIVSCKTSLRERIAQACCWKLKLISSNVTKGVKVFLSTSDADNDFGYKKTRKRPDGKHRNRIIAEYELDGIYILQSKSRDVWESARVKRLERIAEDLASILKARS